MEKQKKILVVDDDSSILETVGMILELEGYKVFLASDGEKGLDLAKKNMPHLIILDITMPKVSGHLFANMVTNDKQLSKTPIILLTGTALIAGGVTLDVPGVVYRLDKPFDHEKLLKIIKRSLN